MSIRTGAEYLDGLHDAREIWLGEERIQDVTTRLLLVNAAHSVAGYEAFQHQPDHREGMTYRRVDGDSLPAGVASHGCNQQNGLN